VAYSIHLSERYNQELERTGSTWTAMERAVTGTGGALLGSAATTVGGFGTLAFAILPPLQQFGIITGMTIIYAFLASVLVLPSLLVVWTKYLGPSDVSVSGDASADETAPVAGEGPAESGAEADPPEAGETRSGTTSTETTGGGDAHPPAAETSVRTRHTPDTGRGQLYAARSVDPSRVRPGQEFAVTVTFPSVSGQVVLNETAPGTEARIDAVTPEPVQAVASANGMYAIWNLDEETTARVTYTVTAPTDANDGQTLSVRGTAFSPDHEVDVAGTGTVVVTTDIVGDILGNGHDISDKDLADVSTYLEAGHLSEEEFERVYHAWLDKHTSATAEPESGDD
jgi:hypothetical protein